MMKLTIRSFLGIFLAVLLGTSILLAASSDDNNNSNIDDDLVMVDEEVCRAECSGDEYACCDYRFDFECSCVPYNGPDKMCPNGGKGAKKCSLNPCN